MSIMTNEQIVAWMRARGMDVPSNRAMERLEDGTPTIEPYCGGQARPRHLPPAA